MNELINLLATTEVEGGQPTDTISTPEVITQPETQVAEQTQPETPETPEVPSKYNIDGEEYDLDTLREWKRSGLRQSDYTKKTQELSRQRKEAEEALEVYKYLMSKPDLVQKLVELDVENPIEASTVKGKLDPIQKEIQELKSQLYIKDIDAELNAITSKDKMVTDIELLEIANSQKCSINTAYNIWRGNNMDKILLEREKELRKTITESIKKNTETTRTLITPTDTVPEVETFGLSPQEIAFAESQGMSAKEYAKYKQPYKW